LNGSDDIPIECNDNIGSDVCLLNDDELLDDEERAAADSLEDLEEPDIEPQKHHSCLSCTGLVVVGVAAVGVLVVIGVTVVVILSVLSLHSSSKVGHHGSVDISAKMTSAAPSSPTPPTNTVAISITLREGCTTKIVGSVNDGVLSFKVHHLFVM